MKSQLIDILAINETRLDESIIDREIGIPGYTLERKDRNRNGGGVALYIRNSLNYERMYEYNEDQLEWLCIKVTKPKSKPFIVGTWYRPPAATSDIMRIFESLIDRLESLDLETNIIGDLNCDVGASPHDSQTKQLLDICNLYQYHQFIEEPIRMTRHTATTIDLFLTNNRSQYSHSGVCHIGISDHSLIYAVRKLCVPKRNSNIMTSRQFRNFDANAFRYDLNLAPWHIIQNDENPNHAWEIWKEIFLKISNIHAPLRKRKIRNTFAPWLTPELKRQMFERDKLKKIATKFKTDENWTNYKRVRNRVNANIKSAKVAYYNNYFNENLGNIKNAWKGVNMIMGKDSLSTEIKDITVDGMSYTSPSEICNVLNAHFVQVGPNLANSIPEANINFDKYITPSQHSFSLMETTNDIVYRLIQSMPLNKACGLDGISCRLLKEAAPVITTSLTYIINLSIRSGIFPDDWKIARVSPVFKEDIKSDPNNYRPISVLPIVSKLIERIVLTNSTLFWLKMIYLQTPNMGLGQNIQP